MRSLATIGYEMKKALAYRKSDNNKKKNNVRSAWRAVSGSENMRRHRVPTDLTLSAAQTHQIFCRQSPSSTVGRQITRTGCAVAAAA